VIDSSPLGLVIRDGFPISPGHNLIIPKRHVGFFFELEEDERAHLLALLDKTTRKEVGPPYKQFPLRITPDMFAELERVAKQTRINKTTISRIALKKFLAQIELVGVGNAINELCEF